MAPDIRAWAAEAAPGARLPYFVGDLAAERAAELALAATTRGRRGTVAGTPLHQANDARLLHLSGHVALAQRREGAGCFTYLAERTRRRISA